MASDMPIAPFEVRAGNIRNPSTRSKPRRRGCLTVRAANGKAGDFAPPSVPTHLDRIRLAGTARRPASLLLPRPQAIS